MVVGSWTCRAKRSSSSSFAWESGIVLFMGGGLGVGELAGGVA